jgi:group I intron endonuclease
MFERKQGVYIIKCTGNNKTYIGSTNNVKQRIWDHQSNLRRGKHSNGKLQGAWNKYGEATFAYDVIEYVDGSTAELVAREQHHIDTLLPEFNIRVVAESNAGKKSSPEAVEKMRKGLTGLKRTQETKDKISAYRKTVVNTPEAIENMRQAHADISEETRLRMSVAKLGVPPTKATEAAAKANKGKPRSQEFKDKISAAKKGKPVKNQLNAAKAGGDATRGKPLSEETLKKRAETIARRKALGLTKHSPETIARIKAARATKTPKHH